MNLDPTLPPDASRDLDSLTGIPNRIALEAYLAHRESEASTEPLAVVSVEIARFGTVTDSVGGDLGNKIIAMVAKRLQKIFTHAVMIARTHGDHFCLVFAGEIDINEQIELLQDFAQRPLALRGEVIVLSVRIGISVLDHAVDSPSELLHTAEIALHRAKRDKLKRCFYQRNQESEAKASHQLENDLRISMVTKHVELHRAISNDEFYIVYQPIIDVETFRVHAVEALIRWRHPKRGVISPANFIPMAEQIQVMDVLGNWIIRRAFSDAMTLPANADGTRPGISVNVSSTQFTEPEILLETVRQALQETGIEPGLVKLEITESTAFSADKRHFLDALRALGCKVALDDFGTGYSSLTQLNLMPLDYIKLDRSFIINLTSEDEYEDQRSDRMTRAALSIATAFDLIPIVEGVETAAQYERLRRYGARLIQGYFFSRPVPLQEVCAFITSLTPPLEGASHV